METNTLPILRHNLGRLVNILEPLRVRPLNLVDKPNSLGGLAEIGHVALLVTACDLVIFLNVVAIAALQHVVLTCVHAGLIAPFLGRLDRCQRL
jgi:hypothetical protein